MMLDSADFTLQEIPGEWRVMRGKEVIAVFPFRDGYVGSREGARREAEGFLKGIKHALFVVSPAPVRQRMA